LDKGKDFQGLFHYALNFNYLRAYWSRYKQQWGFSNEARKV